MDSGFECKAHQIIKIKPRRGYCYGLSLRNIAVGLELPRCDAEVCIEERTPYLFSVYRVEKLNIQTGE